VPFQAFELFRQGRTIDEVMEQTGRVRSTVLAYLCDFIRRDRPASLSHWVTDEVYPEVAAAARRVGADRLKPIYIALGERISYDDIRVVLAHLDGSGR
jgi:ATP-dependent DNA helicase RecQ